MDSIRNVDLLIAREGVTCYCLVESWTGDFSKVLLDRAKRDYIPYSTILRQGKTTRIGMNLESLPNKEKQARLEKEQYELRLFAKP